jgi:protein-S-isoprenylcysteine O-methyltransferase Ste14
MSTDVAHKSWWQIFEVILGIPFLVALALQLVAPLSYPRRFLTPALIPGGVILLSVGVTLVVLARREFAQYGQPTDPGHPTSKIVTTGIFSVSRNPLYLGGVCILLGISLALNLPWAFILLLPSIVACHYILIVPEERYLTAKFGEAFERCRDQVARASYPNRRIFPCVPLLLPGQLSGLSRAYQCTRSKGECRSASVR